MKKRSRLGLACKIVAAVRFALGVVAVVGSVLLSYGNYSMTLGETLALLGLSLLRQMLYDLTFCLILWGIGVLLDRQKQDRQLLERLAQPAQEPEAETLEGVISVDDLESLDGPGQEQ